MKVKVNRSGVTQYIYEDKEEDRLRNIMLEKRLLSTMGRILTRISKHDPEHMELVKLLAAYERKKLTSIVADSNRSSHGAQISIQNNRR